MPYARRTRVHQLTARQLQHLSTLQQRASPGPISVVTQTRFPPPSNAHPYATKGLSGNAPTFEPKLGAGEPRVGEGRHFGPASGAAQALEGKPESSAQPTPASTDCALENANRVAPSGAAGRTGSTRPSSKRSESQTEFEIVQRGVQGNIVLLANESPDALPIEVVPSSLSAPEEQRDVLIYIDSYKTRLVEEGWELVDFAESESNRVPAQFPPLLSATA